MNRRTLFIGAGALLTASALSLPSFAAVAEDTSSIREQIRQLVKNVVENYPETGRGLQPYFMTYNGIGIPLLLKKRNGLIEDYKVIVTDHEDGDGYDVDVYYKLPKHSNFVRINAEVKHVGINFSEVVSS